MLDIGAHGIYLPHDGRRIEGIKQAPYFAKRKWVCVASAADLTNAEREAYLRRSYRLISASLTRKVREELGIFRP